MKYSGQQLREALVRAAEEVWRSHIVDKHGGVNDAITEIFDACGWGHWLRGPHGGCPDGYTRPPDPDWCGLFVGYCGLRIGRHLEPGQCVPVTLRPSIAKKVLPSTYRLFSESHWRSAGVQMPFGIHKSNVMPGDVVTVGTSKAQGTHIVLVESVRDGGIYTTIEGNGRGKMPDGTKDRGCVKRARNVDDIQQVYRLDSSCFVEVD